MMNPEKLSGKQLGLYKIKDILGLGGMAVVYRADYEDRQVALKILFPPLAAKDELQKRFEREGEMVMRLRHPNIVRVVDAGEVDGYAYIAMALVKGETLATFMANRGPISEAEAADIGWQIADALYYAHGQRVIHRDIKPSNIMLTDNGQVLLTDFGVALALDDSALTRTGHTVGTPAYMAPEQASGDKMVDGRADLYALGVVLYQMVTGQTPFKGSTPQVLHAHVYSPPPSPSSIAPVSQMMEKVIMQALAKEPSERFQTGAAMAQALAPIAEEIDAMDAVDGNKLESKFGKSKMWLAIIIGVFVILGLIGWLVYQNQANNVITMVSPSPSATVTVAEVIEVVMVTETVSSTASATATVSATASASPMELPTLLPSPSPLLTATVTPSPLPSPTETVLPTVTPTPSPTAMVCSQTMAGELVGLVDDEQLAVLGCAVEAAITPQAAWQAFEGGFLLWRGDDNLIYILEGDGQRWSSTGDRWREGDLDFDAGIVAPEGLWQPTRGFGLVWRERAGVREGLGWATMEERLMAVVIQVFEGGLVWLDTEDGRVFVLLSEGNEWIMDNG